MKGVLFLIALKVAVVSCQFPWPKDQPVVNSWGSSPTTTNDCETDSGSCNCCLMMQKVDGVRKNLFRKLNDLEAELNKTQKTYTDLTKQQSAFSAALFDSVSNLKCLGPFQSTTIIKYITVFINMGNNYDPSTGIYTAPHNGTYSISVSVYHDAGQGSNEQSCVEVVVNEVMLAGSEDIHTFDYEDSTTVSITVHLITGDKVEVKLKANCTICSKKDHYNVFSGFLLYTD